MTKSIGRQAFWGFAITIIILCIVNIISFRAVKSLSATEQDRAETFRLLTALQKVESELRSADAAQRGFLLTSDPAVLAPYRLSLESHEQNFKLLRDLTTDDKAMAGEIARLEKLAQAKLDDMRHSIEMRGRVGFDAAVDIIVAGKGNQIMKEIRGLLTKLIYREHERLEVRDDQVKRNSTRAEFAMLLGTPAALLVTIFAGFMIAGNLREKEAVANELKAAHAGLEQKVLERTADLASANVKLQDEVRFRQDTEVALAKQRHYLRAMLESLEEGILACDAAGNVEFINSSMRQFLGLPDDGLASSPFAWREHYTFYHMDGSAIEPADLPLNQALAGDPIRNLEVIVEPVNGQRRIVQAVGQHIIDGNGNTLGAFGLLRDITEVKKSQEAMQAQQTAEAANRAKSEFLSRMSHELRTPLNAILGFAQLMEMDPLPPDQMESVDQISRAGRHLLSLINEVLDISRIEAGKLAISLEPVLISEALSEAMSLVAPIAAQKKCSMAVDSADYDMAGHYVRADRQRVKQVLINLLSNAVKYNHSGGWVRITAAEREGGVMRISVSDSGAGISAERMPRLFTPFDRLDADNYGVEGTGLGLCLSKGLVELMGGNMGAESREGEGSTFWFELALTDGPVETAGSMDDAESMEPDVMMQASATVLYVEDNLSNIRLIEKILEQRPRVSLLSAKSATEGIGLAGRLVPDVIFLDLNLPDMHGKEVLAHLRQNPLTEKIPVIIVSADASPGQIKRLMNAGAQNYLTKPISVLQFLEELDSITQNLPEQPS